MTEQPADRLRPNPATGVGVNLRVNAVQFGLGRTDTAVVVPCAGNRQPTPTSLQLDDNGVTATSRDNTASAGRSDVLPRYSCSGTAEYDRERFRLDLYNLISIAETETDTSRIGVDADIVTLSQRGHTVVSVPGVYDAQAREDVTLAFDRADISVDGVVRAPLATAAAQSMFIGREKTFAVIDIGSYWAHVAIIDVDPGEPEYNVRSRVSAPNRGRERMSRRLAEWALEQTADRLNCGVECQPAAFSRVQQAASRALDELASEDTAEISVPGLSAVELGVGNPPISVQERLDLGVCQSELGEIIDEVREQYDRALSRSSVGREQISSTLVSGCGTEPQPVDGALRGHSGFEHPVQRPLPDGGDCITRGTAILARQWSAEPVGAETTVRGTGVNVATPDGVSYREVLPPGVPPGHPRSITLQTVDGQQRQGEVTLASRHPISNDCSVERTVRIGNIPSAPAGEQEIELSVTAQHDHNSELLVSSDSVGERSGAVLKTFAAETESNRSDFAPRDAPVEDIDISDGTGTERVTLTEDDRITDIDPAKAVTNFMRMRFHVWQVVKRQESIPPSEMENLLEKFDEGLRRIGVEPIEPNPGEEFDLREHRAVGTRQSHEHLANTVLEVKLPGHRIDESVEAPADVIVSDGPPESQSEN